VVRWVFTQRLAGHSMAQIARALNDAGVSRPSAAAPARNPHRAGTAWAVPTVALILSNPRCTGRQVWNRQRSTARCSAGTFPTAGLSPPAPRTRRW